MCASRSLSAALDNGQNLKSYPPILDKVKCRRVLAQAIGAKSIFQYSTSEAIESNVCHF